MLNIPSYKIRRTKDKERFAMEPLIFGIDIEQSLKLSKNVSTFKN